MRRDVRSDLIRLVHRGLGHRELASAATKVLERAVPSDGACLLTLDPATMLPTAEYVVNGLPPTAIPRLIEIELQEHDFNKWTTLARGRRPAASLSDATGGRLDRSLRQREVRRPSGFDDELRVALTDDTGTWGALTLLREAGRPTYSDADVAFVASMSAVLAGGVRRATLLDGVGMADGDPAPGVAVLAADDTVETVDAAAGRWLDELGGQEAAGDRPPLAVRAVAYRARRLAGGDQLDPADTASARARVRTPSGRFLMVRGSVLGDGPDARVAVVIEALRPLDMAPLIADAYGLTERERAITELVAQGLTTKEISAELHLAAYTVQDHLKSIFDKSGTRTRGELVSRIFFDHYAPRLRGAEGSGGVDG